MASITVQLDPTSEDSTNTPFDLHDKANGIWVKADSVDWDDPEMELLTAGSADTEGDPLVSSRPRDRHPQLTVCIQQSTASALDTKVGQLQKKIAKLQRDGGTLKRTTPAGNTGVLDIRTAQMAVADDWLYVNRNYVMIPLKFTAAPYWRGPEVTWTTFTETSLPVAIATATGPAGDVDALGRIALAENQGQDQWHYHRGVQPNPGTATTELLHYEAEACLPQGGAAAAGLSGASGGTAVQQANLTTSYQSMLSFASSGTVYPQHVGDFNVWARLYRGTTNTGEVSVALEWAEGDFTRFTRNSEITFEANEREGGFTIANLGQVHLSKVTKGSQRWDGHVLAKSSVVGDGIYVDDWWLQPIGESACEVTISPQAGAPTVFLARDEFSQSAGTLAGKTLPAGGTWAGAGDADDFTVDDTPHSARRVAVSDTDLNSGRFALAGSSTPAAVMVQADIYPTAQASTGGDELQGVLARYTDTSNWLFAGLLVNNGTFTVQVRKRVGGVTSTLWSTAYAGISLGRWTRLRLHVDAGGRWFVWLNPAGSEGVSSTADNSSAVNGSLVALGSDADLATGGTLASGKVGLYDCSATANSSVRYYDNWWAAVPPSDAVVFASKLAEDRYDSFIRQDSSAAVWAEKTVEGDYLRIPPQGNGTASVRVLLKVSRGAPEAMFDSGIDDIAGTIYATPRFLHLPA